MTAIETPVKVIEKSSDRKLSISGSVSATWVSQHSCPKTCPFQNAGCYAENHFSGIITRKLNAAGETNIVELAKMEAAGIRSLTGTRHLRLHIVGDCASHETAQIVAEASREHAAKSGKSVWGYTHYEDVSAEDWEGVSVLQSVQTLATAQKALDNKIAPAIIVSEFEEDKPYKKEGIRIIPCLHQIGKIDSCVNCRLCWDKDKLIKSGSAIAFAAHGSKGGAIKKAVEL